jgi:hypothetical protein
MYYNKPMHNNISTFNDALPEDRKAICLLLAATIQKAFPDAESKVWHGAPVWFLNGNPIAGYDSLKDSVRILLRQARTNLIWPALQNT